MMFLHSEARFHRTHQYSARNNSSLLPTYERLTITQRSVFLMGCQIWNEFSFSIREIKSKNVFGRRGKVYLLNNYIQDQE